MKHPILVFIWILAWPFTCAVEHYVSAARRNIEHRPPYGEEVWGKVALAEIVAWIGVALLFTFL